jgi:hypothetical protein
LLKRTEALPAVQQELERSERTKPVLRVARAVAYSSLDDEKAKAKLAETPARRGKGAKRRLPEFRVDRDGSPSLYDPARD